MSNVVQLKDFENNNIYPVSSIKYVVGDLKVVTYSEKEGDTVVSKSELVDVFHPIGSIYWSSNSTNPSILFGGIWKQIKDKFIFASSDNYALSSTGGSINHTHGELNSQNGTLEALIGSGYGDPNSIAFKHSNINTCKVSTYKVNWSRYGTPANPNSHNTAIYGKTAESSSMPPYVVKYCWERVA